MPKNLIIFTLSKIISQQTSVIPTITNIEQALSAPHLHFNRLREADVVRRNGRPIIRASRSAIESEIILNQRHYLLIIPLDKQLILRIEAIENELYNRSQGPLINSIIYDQELELYSSLGHKQLFDVVLQELPAGMMLDEAVHHYISSDLRQALIKMKSRLDAIGFRHNNLRPSNILVCQSGVIRPLRYWHAEWETYSDNDISPLLELIDSHDNPDSNAIRHPLAPATEDEIGNRPRYRGAVQRHMRYGHYGFVDSDGYQVTPFIYTWASEFCEGRAIVSRNNKMGAINLYGKKVIPIIYKSLEFDISTGFFTATMGKYHYLLDYEGKLIRRWVEDGQDAGSPSAPSL